MQVAIFLLKNKKALNAGKKRVDPVENSIEKKCIFSQIIQVGSNFSLRRSEGSLFLV